MIATVNSNMTLIKLCAEYKNFLLCKFVVTVLITFVSIAFI